MSILVFLGILTVLVIVHEAGHFFVARHFGIRVDEFGIGFPPKIKKLFRFRDTDFFLNSLPFGGYVKIYGENPSVDDEHLRYAKDSFQSKSNGAKALVLSSGVIFNFIFAFLLLSLAFLSPFVGWEKFAFFTSETVKALFSLLYGAINGQADFSAVVGPVGLVGLVGEVSALGVKHLLIFTALISINLGIINLMPLPALDGGRLLFITAEALMRRPIPARVFNALNLSGFAILVFLMILVTIRDIRGVF